jgi:hypothetical protein
MAMPWKRAKAKAKAYRDNPETQKQLTELFDACFRIQREASEAAGHHVPMVVENVKGAQPWVGTSRWRHGPYHLWGDTPALMPRPVARKNSGGSWFAIAHAKRKGNCPDGRHGGPRGKAASALIAKIPFDLAYHIGRTYLPEKGAG